jgi:hypothetical protein
LSGIKVPHGQNSRHSCPVLPDTPTR